MPSPSFTRYHGTLPMPAFQSPHSVLTCRTLPQNVYNLFLIFLFSSSCQLILNANRKINLFAIQQISLWIDLHHRISSQYLSFKQERNNNWAAEKQWNNKQSFRNTHKNNVQQSKKKNNITRDTNRNLRNYLLADRFQIIFIFIFHITRIEETKWVRRDPHKNGKCYRPKFIMNKIYIMLIEKWNVGCERTNHIPSLDILRIIRSSINNALSLATSIPLSCSISRI